MSTKLTAKWVSPKTMWWKYTSSTLGYPTQASTLGSPLIPLPISAALGCRRGAYLWESDKVAGAYIHLHPTAGRKVMRGSGNPVKPLGAVENHREASQRLFYGGRSLGFTLGRAGWGWEGRASRNGSRGYTTESGWMARRMEVFFFCSFFFSSSWRRLSR